MADMNIEQARHNLIEQQIRPWDVLDDTVLETIMRCPRIIEKNISFDMAAPNTVQFKPDSLIARSAASLMGATSISSPNSCKRSTLIS